jgi:hypothetical protein
MRIRVLDRVSTTLSTAAVVALATIMLDACGPGGGSPSTPDASASSEGQSVASQPPSARSTTPTLSASSNTLPAWGANAANVPDAASASDPVQSAQASLAADSQQVTPVMSYAPGDGAQTEASNGDGAGNDAGSGASNDSRRSATSSH